MVALTQGNVTAEGSETSGTLAQVVTVMRFPLTGFEAGLRC